MTNAQYTVANAEIVRVAKVAGFSSCNPTLVTAVVAGSAMRATTGAGVSDALWALIEREAVKRGILFLDPVTA